MADVTKAKNFLLDTDYPLDKIIYLQTGSINIPASTPISTSFPHNLPFTPLSDLVYSLTPDFSTSYMSGSGPAPQDPSLFQLGVDVVLSSTGTYNTIAITNYFTNPITVYFRLYSFEPSNSSADLKPTANSGDPFILNTDYNYTKLYIDNRVVLPSSTIVHNLGYIPQTEAWIELTNQILSPQSQFNLLDTTASQVIGSQGIVATVNTVQLIGTITNAQAFDARVYLDE